MTASTPAGRYSDDFLADMDPRLAAEYRACYPYCRQAVLDAIDRVGSRDFLADVFPEAASVPSCDAIRDAVWEPYRQYHTRSGKMIRPFLVSFLLRSFGRDPEEYPTVVAISELIHAASLVLDDIADDSPLRRGGPAVHRLVGTRVAGTAASAWLSSCFVLLTQRDPGLSASQCDALLDEIAWEQWVAGFGQMIDTSWPWLARYDRDPAHYLQAAIHRSASYSYRLPMKVGAIAAGASVSQWSLLGRFGEEVGLAFQIVDDILDVRSDDVHWGKVVGDDISSGKLTLQVLVAIKKGPTDARERLIEILGSGSRDAAIVREAVSIINACGGFTEAARLVDYHVARSKTMAEEMDFLDEERRALLSAFVDYAVRRRR